MGKAVNMSVWWKKGVFGRLFSRSVKPEAVSLGADFDSDSEALPTYDLNQAMSAYAGFPWLYAAMWRRSSDIAGLPLRVVRGRGASSRTLDDHPFYDLIDNPMTSITGRHFRKQMVVDYRLSGFAPTLLVEAGPGLVSLHRLHPGRTLLKTDPQTGYQKVVFNGAGITLTYDRADVLIPRMVSWEDGPEGLYGTGAILPLHNDLTTDLRASKRAAEMAQRGRPDMIASPKGDMIWTPNVREQVANKLESLLRKGGVMAVSNDLNLEVPTWKPRDMEFKETRALVREAILAVTGVPPHMVGLPSANYALAERQEIAYYQNIMSECSDYEDQFWNPLIRRMYGRGYRVEHDYSAVEALQSVRRGALERAKLWVDLGADPARAVEAEGLGAGPLQPLEEPGEPEAAGDRSNVHNWSPSQLRERIAAK